MYSSVYGDKVQGDKVQGDKVNRVTKSKIRLGDKDFMSPGLSPGLSPLFLLRSKAFTYRVTKVTKFYIEIYKYKNIRGTVLLKSLKCAGYTRVYARAYARQGRPVA